MIYLDYTYLFKNTTLHLIKAEILKYPKYVVNSSKEQEQAEKQYPEKSIKSLADYCNGLLIGNGYAPAGFEHPDVFYYLYDPRIYSRDEVINILKQRGLLIKIIEEKPIKSRFGIFRY